MNHDVFISYSSKNSATALAICHELEDNHIKCWMAPRDIPVGAKYASVIAQAIKSSKAVVLVFSEQSAISPWVESEINIAFSNRKPIVPYKIDAVALESYDEFYLMLNNRHWIESYPDFKTRFAELVEVVARLVGVELAPKANNVAPKDTALKKPKAALKTKAKPASVSMPASAPTPAPKRKNTAASVSTPTPSSAKTYKVGDYYNDGKKEGVVFWVDESGEHGKIVSLNQIKKSWCTNKQYDKYITVGTTSKTDGNANTDKVMIRTDSAEYPAFVWCRKKGEDWYLPARDELKLLLFNDSIHAAVNLTLDRLGATKLWNKKDTECYWTSSEASILSRRYAAIYIGMYYVDSFSNIKDSSFYVRAVAKF